VAKALREPDMVDRMAALGMDLQENGTGDYISSCGTTSIAIGRRSGPSSCRSIERQMPDLRIYGVARTRAFRALWIANELGLDYEHIPIEIGPAGARKAEYLAINPNGRLPAIDDGGFVLWDRSPSRSISPRSTAGSIRRRSKARLSLAMEPVVGAGGRPRRQHLVVACRAASARGP
jgi:hypothetical protein